MVRPQLSATAKLRLKRKEAMEQAVRAQETLICKESRALRDIDAKLASTSSKEVTTAEGVLYDTPKRTMYLAGLKSTMKHAVMHAEEFYGVERPSLFAVERMEERELRAIILRATMSIDKQKHLTCVNVEGVQKSTCSKLGATARRVASTRKNHEKNHLGNSSLVFCPLGRRQCRARGRSAVGGLSRKRAYAWKVAPALEHFARVARQHVEHVIRLAPSQPRLRISPLGGVQGTCELPFPASPKHFFFFRKGGGFCF